MPVVKAKPTSPGRRFVVKVVNPDLHKGEPHKPLLEKKSKSGGRNNHGRIFTRRSSDDMAWYTIASFSRETGTFHKFVSFNEARDALQPIGNWVLEDLNTSWPNILPTGTFSDFSTKDHDGVAIFVLYP